ncbi:hypothetical protein EON65_03190 [archaeon]|nr:MAG: hypothetical protein EON65_03190 [archaeon]
MTRIARLFVVLVLIFTVFTSYLNAVSEGGDEYEAEVEYEYEYEYEDEGDQKSASQEVFVEQRNQEILQVKPHREIYYGFHRNPGGGLMKVKKPIVDEGYLNETAEYYDCIKRDEAWILTIEGNSTVDEELDIMQQIANMKKKVDAAVLAANNMAEALSGNRKTPEASPEQPEEEAKPPAEANANATAGAESSADSKTKRLTFREKQELRLKQRKEKEAQREMQKPKFRLGAACETLICGSCKAVVNEFAFAVHRAVNHSDIRYVEQVMNNFCSSKEVSQKYNDMVIDICSLFKEETLGYKEALVLRFEAEEDWESVNRRKNVFEAQKAVCTAVGACTEKDFNFQSTPETYLQEHWDEKCYVCQAFANDLEERVQLTRHVTERSIVPMVSETCERLVRHLLTLAIIFCQSNPFGNVIVCICMYSNLRLPMTVCARSWCKARC